MYDTRLADTELSLEGILSKVTEYDIYRYYIGSNFKIGSIMSSPLREDKIPSFGIFKSSKTGQLLYKDQATGDSGNCIQFVQKMYNLSYRGALIRAIKDLVTGTLVTTTLGISIKEDYKNTETLLSVKKKPFCNTDDLYWSQFGLDREDLKKFNVYPIYNYWVNDIVKPYNYSNNNPMYAYQVYNKFKIYKPLAEKKHKWVSNCSTFDIQGYEQLEYQGDLVIITKSLKDVMVLTKLGYNAIAPQAENHTIPIEIMRDLGSRFKNIVIFYDNDEPGIKGANKIATKYKLKTISIPDKEIKDISDYVKVNGLDKAKQLIERLLDETF